MADKQVSPQVPLPADDTTALSLVKEALSMSVSFHRYIESQTTNAKDEGELFAKSRCAIEALRDLERMLVPSFSYEDFEAVIAGTRPVYSGPFCPDLKGEKPGPSRWRFLLSYNHELRYFELLAEPPVNGNRESSVPMDQVFEILRLNHVPIADYCTFLKLVEPQTDEKAESV